ncbi:MAG: hypothetical protein A3G25_06175 [Betaproteobacteria bacterium RIFCSPLOWO2_12_FULL_63_13]|nr:MAG: hypothetical protein A3G25_06175 [Betaproteobacteria bacterium RIFCSPLOWO2_12_FULL_63_13]
MVRTPVFRAANSQRFVSIALRARLGHFERDEPAGSETRPLARAFVPQRCGTNTVANDDTVRNPLRVRLRGHHPSVASPM